MLLSEAEGNTEGDVIGESSTDPAQSESLYTHGNSLGGNGRSLRYPRPT